MEDIKSEMQCERELVATYLDGELSDDARDGFEAHLRTCASCQTELQTQRQLLCTLDAAFGPGFALPDDFTRIVQARAESDIRCMRHEGERRKALQLIIILALASFALLGTAWQGSILRPVRSITRVLASLADLIWQTIYDAAMGIAVIARLSGQAIILNPHRLGLFLLFVFVLGISLLPRLIVRYHRTQTIE